MMPGQQPKRTFRGKSKGPNLTAHRRALADPEVQRLLAELCDQWDALDRIERGEKLVKLATLGCSTRGLEDALGYSATNIRRHMTFPKLPEQEREAIRTGSSAKIILDRKAEADRRAKSFERVSFDKRTGELSDRLADRILAFCRASKPKGLKRVPYAPILEQELVSFLSEVRNAVWQMEASGAPPMKLPKTRNLRQRFQRTRPSADPDLNYMAHLAQWLAVFLRAEAPERPIWECAIDKAGKRSKELRVRLTIAQHLQIRQERELLKILGPPPRRHYVNEARRLPRQGSQAPNEATTKVKRSNAEQRGS